MSNILKLKEWVLVLKLFKPHHLFIGQLRLIFCLNHLLDGPTALSQWSGTWPAQNSYLWSIRVSRLFLRRRVLSFLGCLSFI